MVLLLEQASCIVGGILFKELRFRIDMRLTDDHVLKSISELIAAKNGSLTYEQIADKSKCGLMTVIRSTRRLQESGRLEMQGGKGRRPVFYKVVEH